jgi:hypothetical protein
MKSIKWNLINDSTINDKSGVYAWYYDISIGSKDIDSLILRMGEVTLVSEKRMLVSDFLNKRVFSFFKEPSYLARIDGKLMPSFSGLLEHVDQLSESLISKLVENPLVIYEIKEHFNSITSEFMSPIYIGMAENLNSRICRHKALIEKFKRESVCFDNFSDRDESFAARVVSRGMIETKLKVNIKYIESQNNIHNLMENILNRINYPVLGRN